VDTGWALGLLKGPARGGLENRHPPPLHSQQQQQQQQGIFAIQSAGGEFPLQPCYLPYRPF